MNYNQNHNINAPDIEYHSGYLMKLKRKTSLLSSSWNKRWFFIDTKRKEFGYSKNKNDKNMTSSIHLDMITAVVEYDDYQFQIESNQRNFFLRGESLDIASKWIEKLNNYRIQRLKYEKANLLRLPISPSSLKSNIASSNPLSKKNINNNNDDIDNPIALSQEKKKNNADKRKKKDKKDTSSLSTKYIESLPKSAIADLDSENEFDNNDNNNNKCGNRKKESKWESQFSSDDDDD